MEPILLLVRNLASSSELRDLETQQEQHQGGRMNSREAFLPLLLEYSDDGDNLTRDTDAQKQ